MGQRDAVLRDIVDFGLNPRKPMWKTYANGRLAKVVLGDDAQPVVEEQHKAVKPGLVSTAAEAGPLPTSVMATTVAPEPEETPIVVVEEAPVQAEVQVEDATLAQAAVDEQNGEASKPAKKRGRRSFS